MKNKKRLLGILLILAMAIVSVVAITACDRGPIVPGAEADVYVSIGGEHTITLYADNVNNRFALSFGDEPGVRSGVYTLTGTTLTLVFDAADVPDATARLENDEINLTAFNRTTRFLRQVMRTVSFNSAQGTEVQAVQVMNGRPVPVAYMRTPTRGDHEFVGWFLDPSGNTPFEFGVSIIDRNTEIFAYWVLPEPGQEEFTLDFDWGVAGQQNPSSVQTLNGRLYHVPAVIARTGYTFGGWWVSMLENRAMLTYQAVPRTTIFNESTTLHALWIPAGAGLAAPVVQISRNGAINWSPVAGVSTYRLSIINPQGNPVLNFDERTIPGGNTSYVFNFTNLGNYRVELTAVGAGGAVSPTAVRYYRHRALARVSNFRVVNNVLVFSQVANANRYLVSVVCGNPGHIHTDIDIGNTNRFPFTSCEMKPGGIIFTVEARAAGFASSVGTFAFNRELNSITQINIDNASQTATWTAVPGAENYVVSIRREATTTHFENDANTSFSFREFAAGDLEISVRPEAIGYNSPQGQPVWVSFNKATIATPSNVRLDGNTIRWTAVAGAAGYTINIGSLEFDVAGAASDYHILTETQIAALRTMVGYYELSIRANAANSSLFSLPVLVGNFMPGEISYFRGAVSWNHVLGASRYTIIINAGTPVQRVYEVLAGQTYRDVMLTRAGINTIDFMVYNLINQPLSHFSTETSVFAYTITFDIGGNGMLAPEDRFRFVAFGDPIVNFPNVTQARTGHSFDTWYTSPGGPSHNARRFTDRHFAGGDLVLFANWAPHRFIVNLDAGERGTVEDDAPEVVFGRIGNLEVPSVEGNGFLGWFTAPGGLVGGGQRITDERGIMLAPWDIADADDISLYAFYVNVFNFNRAVDFDTGETYYTVSRGPDIALVRHLVVPDYFNGFPVRGISFISHLQLETIVLGKNIAEDGVDANTFDGCRRLTHIHVHPDNPNFSSINGLLFNHDGTTLVRYPTGRAGRFVIPETVTTIGSFAFRDNFYLEVVEIPGTVNIIEGRAFNNNPHIRAIILQEGIQRIEDEAFFGMPSITELIIPRNLQFFGAVVDMTGLDRIVFTGGSTVDLVLGGHRVETAEIGLGGIFEGAFRLRHVVFEPGSRVVNIPDYAFMSNARMYEINIPATVRYIGVGAFEDALFLERIVIADNSVLDRIGARAFRNTRSLREVIFEGSTNLEVIYGVALQGQANASVFADHPTLEKIVLPAGLVSVQMRAFENISNLKILRFQDSPNFTTIGAGAFNGLTALTEIILPARTNAGDITSAMFIESALLETVGVVNAGAGANYLVYQNVLFNANATTLILFPGARAGAGFVLPAATTTICDDALITITNLEAFTVAGGTNFTATNGVLFRGNTLVRYPSAKRVVTFTVPAHITLVAQHAFRGNRYLESIYFAEGSIIDEIAASSFRELTMLTSVDFGDNATLFTIGAYTFADSFNLAGLRIPGTVMQIGRYAFRGVNLAFLELGFGMTHIPDFAFAGNPMDYIYIPYTVTHIGEGAFANAVNLYRVTFVGRRDSYGNSITEIGDPTAPMLTHIGDRAFENTALRSVNDIIAGAEYIGARAFYNIAFANRAVDSGVRVIHEIYIPGTVTWVGDSAFQRAGRRVYGPGDIRITFGAVPNDSNNELRMGEASFANIVRLLEVNFDAGSNVRNIGTRAFEYTMVGTGNNTASNNPDLFDGTVGFEFNHDVAFSSITIPITVEYIGDFAFRGTGRGINRSTRAWNDSLFGSTAGGAVGQEPRTADIVPVGLVEIIFEGGDILLGEGEGEDAEGNEYTYTYIQDGGSNIHTIGIGAFQGAMIGTIDFPHSLHYIKDLAFAPYNATMVAHGFGTQSSLYGRLVMGQNVRSIGFGAFGSLYGLEGIVLNYGLETIGERAFARARIISPFTAGHAYLYDNILTNSEHLLYEPNRPASMHIPAVRTGLLTEGPVCIHRTKPTADPLHDAYCNCGRLDPNTILNGDLVIPDTVRTIGANAFQDAFMGQNAPAAVMDALVAAGLPDVTAPAGTLIPWNRRLQRIFIGQNSQLTTLIDNPFNGSHFAGENTLYLPSTLRNVGIAAISTPFAHMRGTLVADVENLTNYEIANDNMGNRVVSMFGAGTPLNTPGFTALEIIGNATTIPDVLFSNNRFRNITISANITSIGEAAFRTAGADLETLKFEEGSALTSMGFRAFSNLWFDQSPNRVINLPATVSVAEIYYAFGANTLEFETTYVLENPIEGETILPYGSYTVLDGVLFDYTGTTLVAFPLGRGGAYAVPAYGPRGTPVTAIGPRAFGGGTDVVNNHVHHGTSFASVTQVTLPDSITTIGAEAFRNARNLISVDLDMYESNLAVIGNRAFWNARNLAEFTIPNSLTPQGLAANAFEDAVGLQDATVYLSLDHPYFTRDDFSIRERDTDNIVLVTGGTPTIIIPYGMTTIPGGMFANRTAIQRVYIHSRVTSIGAGAFDGATGLEEIIFTNTYRGTTEPSRLTAIHASAFRNTAIGSLYIPASVETIGADAFCAVGTSHNNLTEVIFGEGSRLITIGSRAFRHNRGITSIEFPSSLLAINDDAFSTTNIGGHLILPASLQIIGMGAFHGILIQYLTFEDNSNMLDIGIWAFRDTVNLRSINFGADSSLRYIREAAFSRNNSLVDQLTHVYLPDQVAELGRNLFEGRLNFQAYNVSENNINFVSEDGVLLNRARNELVRFPHGKLVTTYAIPSSVRVIRENAFNIMNVAALRGRTLNNLILHNGVTTIEHRAINAGALTGAPVYVNIPLSVRTIAHHGFNSGSTAPNLDLRVNVQGRHEHEVPWEEWHNGAWTPIWNTALYVEVDVFFSAGPNGSVRANAETAGGELILNGGATLANSVVFTALPNIGFTANWTLNGVAVDETHTNTLVVSTEGRRYIEVSVAFTPTPLDDMVEVGIEFVGNDGTLSAIASGHTITPPTMTLNRYWTIEFVVSGLASNWATRWYIDDVFVAAANEFRHTLIDDVEIRAVPAHILITVEILPNAAHGVWNLSNRFGFPHTSNSWFNNVFDSDNAAWIPEIGQEVGSGGNANTLDLGHWIRFQAPAPANNAQWMYEWRVNGVLVSNYAVPMTISANPVDLNREGTVGTHGNTHNEIFLPLTGRYHVTVQRVTRTVNWSVDGTGGVISRVAFGNANPAAGTVIANSGDTWAITNHAINVAGRLNFTATPDSGYRVKHWIVNGVIIVPQAAAIDANGMRGRWAVHAANPNILVRGLHTPGFINVQVVFEPIS